MRDLPRVSEVSVIPVTNAAISVSKPRMATKKDLAFIALSKTITEKERANDLKYSALYFTRSVEMMRVLSGPEIYFLMLVIEKTNYGTLKDVPIPRADIIKDQNVPSLAVKQIREKLVDLGFIVTTQKRIGRGSEAWHYSLNESAFERIVKRNCREVIH